MAKKHSKGSKKSTSGLAAINDNKEQPAENTSISESEARMGSGNPAALDLPDADRSGHEASGTEEIESHAAGDPETHSQLNENQRFERQTAGAQTTGSQEFIGM